jgi:hypothetical protein
MIQLSDCVRFFAFFCRRHVPFRVGTFKNWAGELVVAQVVKGHKSNGPEKFGDSASWNLSDRGPILLTQKLRSFVKMTVGSMLWARGEELQS